jgi:hypothetical protein
VSSQKGLQTRREKRNNLKTQKQKRPSNGFVCKIIIIRNKKEREREG